MITAENGKALPDARGEVAYAAEFFRWYAEEAVRIRGEVSTARCEPVILVQHQPIGVCVLITPVELPRCDGHSQARTSACRRLHRRTQARHADPMTSLAIAQLMVDAGVPAGVVT